MCSLLLFASPSFVSSPSSPFYPFSSYRFGEVLLAGGIPVIVPGTIPPLHPEIDWGRCIVTVSETRIVDLPRLLRGMSEEEVRKRQTECQRLFNQIIKEADEGIKML